MRKERQDMTSDKKIDDLGIRFETQDTEWLLSSIDLMLATGMTTSCSPETRERMKHYRGLLEMQSALPRHSGSYGDAFRFNDAIEAVKVCSAWEARLIVNRSSFFKDVTFAIETYRDGKRRQFKLTSDLSLGRDAPSDADPLEQFGVYLNRLVAVCQGVAPTSASQVNQQTVKVLADWRAFYAHDADKMKAIMGNLLSDSIRGPFAVREVQLSRWTVVEGNTLPERLRHLDVAVSASDEGHARLAAFLEEYNARLAQDPSLSELRNAR
jgi:hypothetical protein